MRRALVVPFVVCALVTASTTVGRAGAPPTGTISCTLAANATTGLQFSPPISFALSSIRLILKDKTITGACDASGVSGGRWPITAVKAQLLAKLAAGTRCADVVTAPEFGTIKLKLRWTGVDEIGRERMVATSAAHLVAGGWDDADGALVFTATIFRGAFAGSSVTARFTLDNPGFLAPNCPPITGVYYGADGESTITVP